MIYVSLGKQRAWAYQNGNLDHVFVISTGLPERATKLYDSLKKRFVVEYDDAAAIGKRYRRMDEAGTPYCFTIDGDTLKDGTVTVRERDKMTQERISEEKVGAFLEEKLSG